MLRHVFTVCALFSAVVASGQDRRVIKARKDYLSYVNAKPAKQMVDLQTFIPDILLDIRYATTNNCTHTQLYRQPKAYLRRRAAVALRAVQQELAEYQMSLLVYDAYRPLSVTRKIWDAVHDERYAARPDNGSGHNRGLSVDVSLFSTQLNRPADMGTDFDSFSDSSSITFDQIPKSAWLMRHMLRDIMVKHGFKPLATEWWHFSYTDKDNCELLDVPFEELQ